MSAVAASALVLAGLESAKLLFGIVKSKMDSKDADLFEADYGIYILQKTLPDTHPDLNDSLFLRVRDRLLKHVQKINELARANGKDS